MSEKKERFFQSEYWVIDREKGRNLQMYEVIDLLNEQQATIEHLKQRVYYFEKRKIIEESEIDEDVIPRIKLLRTELFGEKYE